MFNFEHLDILCAQIGHPFEWIRPNEFLERFRCSISSVWICDAPESDIWVKSYDHLNFKTASVVQFCPCRYITRLNLTSVWKVMAIWISRELQLFNFVRLDILYARIGQPSEMLWQFEFLESFSCSISSVSICDAPELDLRVKSSDHFNFLRATAVQFWASWYWMRLNRAFEWKDITIWIARELPLFNFKRLYLWYARIGQPSEKLWQFELLESFRCSISSVSIRDAPE